MTARNDIIKEIELRRYVPYTYLIGWSNKNLWYYGARYASNCHPSDLWVTYFTSSNYVKQTREKLGEPNIVEVRKTFITANEALCWENRLLEKIDAPRLSNWLNRQVNGRILSGPGNMNGMFGKKHSAHTRKQISEKAKLRTSEQNGMFGKTHTDEMANMTFDNIGFGFEEIKE